MKFQLKHRDESCGARLGTIDTQRGQIQTPVFMPVGTLATVKTLDSLELREAGSQIILGNTYHLLLRPGPEVFKKFGGIHRFMSWSGPVLTDSGGFQIFSLPRSRKMTEEGAVFQSYVEGDLHHLSPESSLQMQRAIGSDIMMVLDQCIESTADRIQTREAMELTHRWAVRSLKAHRESILQDSTQALFGIVQGGVFKDLRKESVQFLTQLQFDGFAIGGLAVGESKSQREEMTEIVCDLLPQFQPRYLMGVGTPRDLLEAILRGVDMFDCIIPTKMAQQGNAYTGAGEVKLAQQIYKLSDDKLDPTCNCKTCQVFSRGYLHHLTKCRETLGWRALAFHNVTFFNRLMAQAREAIAANEFLGFYKASLALWEETAEETASFREPPVFTFPKKPKGNLVESVDLISRVEK